MPKGLQRNILIGIVLMVLSAFIADRFIRLPLKKVSVFEAVPVTVPMFVCVPNLEPETIPDTLDAATQAWLSFLPGLKADFDLIHGIVDSASISVKRKEQAVFMIQKIERDNWGLSMVADLGNAREKLSEMLERHASDQISQIRFKNQIVYEIKPAKGQTFSIGQYRNLLIIGRLPIAVEDVIRQLKDYQGSLWKEAAFRSLVKEIVKIEAPSIYIQPGFFSDYFRHQIAPNAFERLQKIEASFEWLHFDIQTDTGQWHLSGQFIPAVENKKIKAFLQQKEQSPKAVFRLIPEDIAMFYYWGFSDFQSYYDQIQVPLIDRFERFIMPWVGNEIVQVVVDPAGPSTCVLVETKDPEIAREALDRLLMEAGQLKAYQHNSFQVQQLLEEDLFAFLPFGPLKGLRNPHILFLEHYVLFAPSRSAMEIWLDQYVVGNTLSGDANFIQFQKTMPAAFHQLLFFNANNWPDKMAVLNPFFRQFPNIGLAMRGEKRALELVVNASPSVKADTSGNLLWRVNLSSEVILAPELVSMGEMGKQVVATQDAFYNFYVFEAGGDLLWQKKLDGPVKAPIHSFDYYNDGHFHLLFNTQNSIYLLDEYGKSRNNYPLPLRNPASSGLTFVDFKQDNNPSFFVAGQNEQVYGFDRRGLPIPGWNPLFNSGYLSHPLLHFQHGINDYLVAQDDTARVAVFSKDGTLRFEVKDSNAVFRSPPGFQLSERSNRIVAVDQRGIAHILNLQGDYFRLSLQVGQNLSVRFAYADVVGNTDKDYIAMSGKDLAIYHYATQGFVRTLQHQFDYEQDSLFAVPVLNQQKSLIGTLNKKQQLIQLIDSRGRNLPGFPIRGTTAFSVVDLFGDGRPVVLGADGTAVFGIGLSGGGKGAYWVRDPHER